MIIFAERKQDVDAIHEYLLLKGVDTVSIHGGKDQEERVTAVKMFRERQRDVLVATDVASKGLDFPDIMHVINYDMPEDIENYGKKLSFDNGIFLRILPARLMILSLDRQKYTGLINRQRTVEYIGASP